ncbi:hypothetical protein SAMN04488550_4134 [Gordonia malaquae]|uniref:Terminase large subunit n=1 Tax=Gordonia malaquae NBRC 108250 TaxID=1223542 RepID=M3TIA4_GORML|nr:hypothetical protein [Gordonia malaquae]GAC81236.1 hypothetical protein GM1_030_00650 [Gordonia malaquae NBRC 108250]SEE24536.1 hypothetical protein SAMN04488550_4134 [Gordonia malaquae]
MAGLLVSTTEVSPDAEYDRIIAWYRAELARSRPVEYVDWPPVIVGPTWKWTDDGWHLPAHSLGWGVLAWCGAWLRDKHGQPWQFTLEQARFLLWYYAVDERGRWLYHSAVLQRLKGHGKDPVAACVSLAACFGPVVFDGWVDGIPVGANDPTAWVQLIAVSQRQTQNTMKLFPTLVTEEARARYGIQIGRLNLWGLGDSVQVEAITASFLSIEGGRPTQVIRNETQNWNSSNQGHEMAGAIEGNAAKSENGAARMLDVCNAYRPGEDSVAERVRDAADAAARANVNVGILYDSLEAPAAAPLTIDAAPAVLRSIAGDSVWLDTDPDGRIVQSILNKSNDESESRRKWYNQVVATADALIDPAVFDELGSDDRLSDGDTIVLGFDGGKTDDATALIAMRVEDRLIQPIGIWQAPDGAAGRDWEIDRTAVDGVVRNVFGRYDVVGFFADVALWESYVDQWSIDFRDQLAVKASPRSSVGWDMRGGKRDLTLANESLVSAVVDERVRFTTGRPVDTLMRTHVLNARRRLNSFGLSFGKEHRESARKVDGWAALLLADMARAKFQESGKRSKPRTGEAFFF